MFYTQQYIRILYATGYEIGKEATPINTSIITTINWARGSQGSTPTCTRFISQTKQ